MDLQSRRGGIQKTASLDKTGARREAAKEPLERSALPREVSRSALAAG